MIKKYDLHQNIMFNVLITSKYSEFWLLKLWNNQKRRENVFSIAKYIYTFIIKGNVLQKVIDVKVNQIDYYNYQWNKVVKQRNLYVSFFSCFYILHHIKKCIRTLNIILHVGFNWMLTQVKTFYFYKNHTSWSQFQYVS